MVECQVLARKNKIGKGSGKSFFLQISDPTKNNGNLPLAEKWLSTLIDVQFRNGFENVKDSFFRVKIFQFS